VRRDKAEVMQSFRNGAKAAEGLDAHAPATAMIEVAASRAMEESTLEDDAGAAEAQEAPVLMMQLPAKLRVLSAVFCSIQCTPGAAASKSATARAWPKCDEKPRRKERDIAHLCSAAKHFNRIIVRVHLARRRRLGNAARRRAPSAWEAVRDESKGRQRRLVEGKFELRGNLAEGRALLHGENPGEGARGSGPRVVADSDEGAVADEGEEGSLGE
jgi:hypothetical protein